MRKTEGAQGSTDVIEKEIVKGLLVVWDSGESEERDRVGRGCEKMGQEKLSVGNLFLWERKKKKPLGQCRSTTYTSPAGGGGKIARRVGGEVAQGKMK